MAPLVDTVEDSAGTGENCRRGSPDGREHALQCCKGRDAVLSHETDQHVKRHYERNFAKGAGITAADGDHSSVPCK